MAEAIVSMAKGFTAISQTVEASKQASAIRNDTAVLFPSRSQAIALGMLAYRAETKTWPASSEDLHAFFIKHYRDAAPPESELADLRLELTAAESIHFSFVRPGLSNERYSLTTDGTISFSLTPKPEMPVPSPGQPNQPNAYLWNEFTARLFVELPLVLLLHGK
ncbi:MAG: hypothetical protein H7Y06_01975 [Opitutaceae bacterium]|nr:hypothetical protein [Opitutaceae bacterium]